MSTDPRIPTPRGRDGDGDATRARVRDWLLDYAWIGTPDERAREVECILTQDRWQYLAAAAERARVQAADDTSASEAAEYALSVLYECHEGPHLPTCRAAVTTLRPR